MSQDDVIKLWVALYQVFLTRIAFYGFLSRVPSCHFLHSFGCSGSTLIYMLITLIS